MNNYRDDEQPVSDPAKIASQVMESWADAIAAVLESVTGHRPKTTLREAPADVPRKDLVWWGQKLSILEQPSFWIGAPQESWAALTRLTLSELGIGTPGDADLERTCGGLLTQAVNSVASQLHRFAGGIKGEDSVLDTPPDADRGPVFSWTLDAGLLLIEGEAVCCRPFIHELSRLSQQAGTAKQRSLAIPKLDLKVKFILGRTTLPLREVFKLNVGTVIRLDQSPDDPAAVVIHGRVLAQGKVVTADGACGLRILPNETRGMLP